jgi:hypothetical protein
MKIGTSKLTVVQKVIGQDSQQYKEAEEKNDAVSTLHDFLGVLVDVFLGGSTSQAVEAASAHDQEVVEEKSDNAARDQDDGKHHHSCEVVITSKTREIGQL